MVDYKLVPVSSFERVLEAGIADRDAIDVDSDHFTLWAVYEHALHLKSRLRPTTRRQYTQKAKGLLCNREDLKWPLITEARREMCKEILAQTRVGRARLPKMGESVPGEC